MNPDERRAAYRELYAQATKDGRHIVDERCSCGHSRFDHLDTFSLGHGSCTLPDCPCRQFTWVSWVLE